MNNNKITQAFQQEIGKGKDANLPVVFSYEEVEALRTLLYLIEMADSDTEREQVLAMNRRTRNELRAKCLFVKKCFKMNPE